MVDLLSRLAVFELTCADPPVESEVVYKVGCGMLPPAVRDVTRRQQLAHQRVDQRHASLAILPPLDEYLRIVSAASGG